MRVLLPALALTLIACAHAQNGPPPPPRVDEVLATDHVDPSTIRAMGPDAEPAFVAAAEDRTRSTAQRARALHALAYIANAEAQDQLRAASADRTLDRDLRLAAVHALLERTGGSGASLLQPVLDDPDPRLRLEVARALGAVGGPLARQVLQSRLDKETDGEIREALQKSLTEAQP